MLKNNAQFLNFTQNYITKKIAASINSLFQDHILKSHDFFSTYVLIPEFSGTERSKDEFQDFSAPVRTLILYRPGKITVGMVESNGSLPPGF